ncbi:hypothetical protein G7046_g4041 [Stylonectria norvegica]|nr:hypothetical protein G7046_g4041 [Stylonectria norvegica]
MTQRRLGDYVEKVQYSSTTPLSAKHRPFNNGTARNPPIVSSDLINRILLFPGSFNPPHQGHLKLLKYVYENAGDDLNIVAAIVLPTDDERLAEKMSGEKEGYVLSRDQRVNLWRGKGLPVDWAWIYDKSEAEWADFRLKLERTARKDGIRIRYILLGGPDWIGSSFIHDPRFWNCKDSITSDVSRAVDFRHPKNLVQLNNHTFWEKPDYSRIYVEDRIRDRFRGKSEDEISQQVALAYRKLDAISVCNRLQKPKGTIRFIPCNLATRSLSVPGSTQMRRLIANTPIEKLQGELVKVAMNADILAEYVRKGIRTVEYIEPQKPEEPVSQWQLPDSFCHFDDPDDVTLTCQVLFFIRARTTNHSRELNPAGFSPFFASSQPNSFKPRDSLHANRNTETKQPSGVLTTAPLAAGGTAETPLPYVAGQAINLKTPCGRDIHVVVSLVYPITVSPVMEVSISTANGLRKAILKLFDRRFGELREKRPYNEKAEKAWLNCVRSGSAQVLLESLQSDEVMIQKARFREERSFDNSSSNENGEEDDNDNEYDDSEAYLEEEEAIMYHTVRKLYKNEVRAYKELELFQGQCIPRFIDSVVDSPLGVPSDLPAVYFQVPGVLIEYISGFSLSALTSKIPARLHLRQTILDNAVAAVDEVNNAGVVHLDCRPRNILVAERAGIYQSYLIDFAQCAFRADYKDTEDINDKKGFRYLMRRTNNHGAIANFKI